MKRSLKVVIGLSAIVLVALLVLVFARNSWKTTFPTTSMKQQIEISDTNRLVKRIKVLVESAAGRVSWSHQNNLIAFGKNGSDGYADIYTMNADGTGQVCLTCSKSEVPQLSNDQPEWHPSGEYIVFQAQDPNLPFPWFLKFMEKSITQGGAGVNNNLWTVTKDGKRFYQLTHINNLEASLHPHFSHDGKKLFWAARVREGKRNYAWALKVADFVVDSQGIRLVNQKVYPPFGASQKAFYESHGFTPDDRSIIFSGSKSENVYDLDIDVMDLATSKLINLTNTPGEWDEHAILSPSGQKIVWMSSHGYPFTPTVNWAKTLLTDYWLMNSDGSGKTKLTYFNEPGYPEYSGDNVIVADSDWNREGDKIVALWKSRSTGRSKIILIELRNTQ